MPEPSGLDATRGAATGGHGLDPAYPRAMVTDLDPPWNDHAQIDAALVYSEFVAPWRYPEHNMAGMRNGWEAPRTHVGPYLRGDDAKILMGGMPGSDVARRMFEDARSPAQTDALAGDLIPEDGAHLGDPLDYGAYLIGKLTGAWTIANGAMTYAANDQAHPLPDFNLDSDRGYAYQCWDYMRHRPSVPPAAFLPLDLVAPDQWQCAPQLITVLSEIAGRDAASLAVDIRPGTAIPSRARCLSATTCAITRITRRATTRSSAWRTSTCHGPATRRSRWVGTAVTSR